MKFSVTPDRFQAQMALLDRLGVQSWLPGGTIDPNAGSPCFITFDDGHKSNLSAASLMRELDLKACFYIVKEFALQDPSYLDESEIKEIAAMGHMVGVHGKTHDWWTKFDDAALTAGLSETRDWLEDLTGQPVVTCSAPGGKTDDRVIRCIRKQIPGLTYIRTSRYGTNREGDTLLNSVAITRSMGLDAFRKTVVYSPARYLAGSVGYGLKEMAKPIYHFFKR